MEKIDISKIRGHWQEQIEREVGLVDNNGIEYGKGKTFDCAGGDDTIKSIKIVAEKVNEIIEKINKLEKFTGNNLST